MRERRSWLFVLLAVLVLVSLACGIQKQTPAAAPTQEAVVVQPTEAEIVDLPVETAVVEPTTAPIVEQTEEAAPTQAAEDRTGEFRSEAGGYSFLPAEEWSPSELFGMTFIMPPDADMETGPMILMVGTITDTTKTNDELQQDFLNTEMTGDDYEIVKQEEITIGGVKGYLVDMKGTQNGKELIARAVFAAVTDKQSFIMFGIAPADRWGELEPKFDSLLDTILFFEPTVSADDWSDLGDLGDLGTTPASGEEMKQWAFFAWASSEYGSDDWSASQIVGEPNTNGCADALTAWASSDKTSEDWIYASFITPVIPSQINIHQSWYPGYITQVWLVDVNGAETLYYEAATAPGTECPSILTIDVTGVDYQVANVKIVLDQSGHDSSMWSEIDAVELVGVVP